MHCTIFFRSYLRYTRIDFCGFIYKILTKKLLAPLQMLQEQLLMHKKRLSNKNKTLLIQPVSQWSPVNPCRHLHLYVKASSMQVPSLWHGFSAQSKISVTIIKLITSYKWPQESPVVYHNSLANQKKRFNDAINQRHFKIIQPSRLKHTKLLLLISSKEQSTTWKFATLCSALTLVHILSGGG